MNKKTKILLGLAAASVMAANVANAVTIVGEQLQGVLDNITVIPAAGSSTDVHTDQLNFDSYWAIGGSGASVETVVFNLTADFANRTTFGLYDRSDSENKLVVYVGQQVIGKTRTVSIDDKGNILVSDPITGLVNSAKFAGNNFGYYIDTGYNIWYSDNSLNNGEDHLAAYQGQGDTIKIPNRSQGVWLENEYMLAWEDLPLASSDRNYADLVIMVESVNPTPDAGTTLMLLGMGMLGLGSIRRKLA